MYSVWLIVSLVLVSYSPTFWAVEVPLQSLAGQLQELSSVTEKTSGVELKIRADNESLEEKIDRIASDLRKVAEEGGQIAKKTNPIIELIEAERKKMLKIIRGKPNSSEFNNSIFGKLTTLNKASSVYTWILRQWISSLLRQARLNQSDYKDYTEKNTLQKEVDIINRVLNKPIEEIIEISQKKNLGLLWDYTWVTT